MVEIKKQLHQSAMHGFFAKSGKIHEICKLFSKDLVNEKSNAPRRGVVPGFSDLEVIALSLTAETESIDSENRLFEMLKKSKDEIPDLISRRQYNDRRKHNAGLCEEIRRRMALAMDGGGYFCIDSKPAEVCREARGKRCKMGKAAPETAPDFGFCASQGVYYVRTGTTRKTGSPPASLSPRREKESRPCILSCATSSWRYKTMQNKPTACLPES